MESFLLRKKSTKSYLESISTYAQSSRSSYQSVVNRLEEFSNECYNGRTTQDIINELRSLSLEQRDEAYYGVLQDYINWLLKRNLSNKTVNNHFKVIKHYFSYYGIRADPIALKHNVNRPREIKEKLHPLTLEEIHKLFQHAIPKRKMLYLVLIGSGMRIRECVALRKKDFDLDFPKRIKIDIPAQYTKTKTAHTTFVTKEAEKYLKSKLNTINDNDLVFATNQDPYHASMTEIEAFTRYRNAAGLNDKYESANRHHITLHSFRSYFFTRARRAHDTDIAHAMVGHTPYLDMYDRKDDLEKLELCLKVEPSLKVNFNGPFLEKVESQRSSRPHSQWLSSFQCSVIQNTSDFKRMKKLHSEFLIVSDKKKGNKLHKPSCKWLKVDHFVEKVITKNAKNGKYYLVRGSEFQNWPPELQKCNKCLSDSEL